MYVERLLVVVVVKVGQEVMYGAVGHDVSDRIFTLDVRPGRPDSARVCVVIVEFHIKSINWYREKKQAQSNYSVTNIYTKNGAIRLEF
jgi:hypothetical protein